jgi:transcriptional regulator with PAS, ATPase and Fis domain
MTVAGDWETEARAQPGSCTVPIRAATIEVIRGPSIGTHARVTKPTFVIGTGAAADLRVEDSAVSREHVRVRLVEQGVELRDEGSKNGTWLAGVRIGHVTVTKETTITIGGTSIVVRPDRSLTDLVVTETTSFGDAIGTSTAMRHLFAILERAARSDLTVLLEGESGTGKEVLARALHDRSARRDGPFVAVDCGAIPATLIESELFGHERGAFTGAERARRGLFEEAASGTLFLDEIGELPLDLQPKLLRVLEQREVRAIGAKEARRIDVRVLAATNRRLADLARRNEFRADLYYRLAVARIAVPPLRDRPDDILPLATAFLRRVAPDAALDPDFAALLAAYRWPGNVRELRNVIERHALLGLRDPRSLFDTAVAGAEGGQSEDDYDLSHLTFQEARRIAIERFERVYAERVLARAGGVVSRAAELAGVARGTFYRIAQRGRGERDDD